MAFLKAADLDVNSRLAQKLAGFEDEQKSLDSLAQQARAGVAQRPQPTVQKTVVVPPPADGPEPSESLPPSEPEDSRAGVIQKIERWFISGDEVTASGLAKVINERFDKVKSALKFMRKEKKVVKEGRKWRRA
jgi:hypothetical protein